jgi:hypothetical protein
VGDFDLGCGIGAVNWDSSNRVYRIASTKQWALASLIDSYAYLPASQVPAFKGLANKLLDAVNGYGHPCSLVTKPTATGSRIYFDILVAGANIKDTFYTSVTGKGGLYKITQISPLTDTFMVKTGAGPRPLTVRLTDGIDYRVQSKHASGQVRFRVAVTASKVKSCHRGATGTLTVSTKPAVLLAVCGQTFLKGPAPRVNFIMN